MKRPFALVGFTYLFSLILCGFFSSIGFVISASFFVLFIASLFFKDLRVSKTIPIIFLTISLAFFVNKIAVNFEEQQSSKLIDHDAIITGTICEDPIESYGKYYYTIKTDSISIEGSENIPQNIKIRISKPTAFDCDVFDKITGKIHFYQKDSDNIFSSKNYYAARGIHNFAYFYEYEDYSIKEETFRPPYYYCIKCKQILISSLRQIFPKKYYSIAIGMLLGNKYFIDEEIISDFKSINISHLLSVSGFHVSIIAQFFLMLFALFKLSKKKKYLFTIFCILWFMAIVGFTPAVSRAGIMLIIAYIGKMFFKHSDSINSLGLAAIILTIGNPFAGHDISLILSFSATLGIILFSDKINDKINKLLSAKIKKSKNLNPAIKYLISIISVTIAATVATIPITVFYFKKFSFISIVANLLLVVPAMIVLILTLITAITNIFSFLRFITMPLALVNGLLINYITTCAKILAALPFSSVSTAQPFLLFFAASTLLIFAIDLILKKELKIRKTPILLSFILLLVGCFSHQILNKDIITLTTVDVGSGCSLVLTKNNHAAVLSCGGESFEGGKLTTCLNNKNIKNLDYLVLSDLKERTSCYSKDIIKKYNPNLVILKESSDVDNRLSRAIADSSNSCYFDEKSNIKFWDNITLKVINSDEQSFMYLTINDVNLLICPSGGNLSYIPNEYTSCDIFIEGVYPTELDSINASYMIMSNNENLYKSHVKDVIKSQKIPISTAINGTVDIDFINNKTIKFRRVRL